MNILNGGLVMAKLIWQSAIKWTVLAAVVVALVAPIGAIADEDNRVPDLGDCEEVQVEAGHKVAYQAYAEGVQIYRWNGTAWTFVAPDAVLYSGDGEDSEVVGIHYAGPTWESDSGSKVVATVVDRCTPDPDAIPWLLLKAVSSDGPGIFHRVTYIQRLYTVGGLAPAAPGDFVGEEAEVPYSAWYVFYRKQ
jgi:hypothetical protein